MRKTILQFFVVLFLVLAGSALAEAQVMDLSKSKLMVSSGIDDPVRETAVRTMQEEIRDRTSLQLSQTTKWGKHPVIVLAKSADDSVNGKKVPVRQGKDYPENKPEGYRLIVEKTDGQDVLWLIGADDRAVIFAIGEFLRKSELSSKKILFDKQNEVATSPEYKYRGHQLGYRHTANSWDAWTVEQFDQHIRELAFFGTNIIENIPFHDGGDSPVMTVPRKEMNIRMSEICDNYDLDYRIWVPSEVDLSDKDLFEKEVKMHAEYYQECPRLDGVFFPGGDPGKNDPRYVMPFLERLSAELEKYHPQAELWISLQGFNDAQVDYFYEYLDEHDPDWLTGVTTGPGSPGIAETRYRLPEKYIHTVYPDITHTVRCDYPVLDWDQAFALTEGREVSNPQPYYYAKIHNKYAHLTEGFVSYSDGVHDDVNKYIWSQLAWNTDIPVNDILEDYSRLFFGPELAKPGANGILTLERNWAGPIEENGGIETSFVFWQELEKSHPELKDNWRWQQLLLRSYYDTYTARRKIYETGLEKQANEVLLKASETGAEQAMKEALKLVQQADTKRVYPELRQRIVDLCEDMWQSIGMQTSVEKYHAKNPERGAILDFVDYPLNNRWWLEDEFTKISKMTSEKEKLDRLKIIATWEDPGKGSYYDNISNVSQSPHVTTGSYDATDVAWWNNGMSRERLSTQLFQNFPVLEYEDLDPEGKYMIRISGEGDALLRINGERIRPHLYEKGLGEFKEFHVGRKYLSTGKITVTFDEPEESHLNWRQLSKVSDIWLLKLD